MMRLNFVLGIFVSAGLALTAGLSAQAGQARRPAPARVLPAPAPVLNISVLALLGREHNELRRANLQGLQERAPSPTLQTLFGRLFGRRKTASAPLTYDPAWLASQATAQGGRSFDCLTQALYFEARGESIKGQFAVGEVILNRVNSSRFPNTVCGVIHQGTGKRFQCQFTYTCDGRNEVINNRIAYGNVAKVARALLDGAPRVLTDGATYYHNRKVRPRWARKFTRTAKIGRHYFYRTGRRALTRVANG